MECVANGNFSSRKIENEEYVYTVVLREELFYFSAFATLIQSFSFEAENVAYTTVTFFC